MSDTYKLYFDGGKRKNRITYGFVIFKNDEVWFKDGGSIKMDASSNAAEYIGLNIGLLTCALFKIKNIDIYGDSLLIISQINGDFQIKSKKLLPYYWNCREALVNFDSWRLTWIPRKANYLADRETRYDG